MRLNLGSGNNHIAGFISVDKYDAEAHVRADITELPYDDNSVDEIVAYQVIEHLPYNLSQQFFEEMYRVLKPGSQATVECPDMAYICRAILSEGLSDHWLQNIYGAYYRPWDKNRYDDWEMQAGSIHRNGFDFDRVKKLADYAGFSGVTRLTPDQSKYKELENLAVRLVK